MKISAQKQLCKVEEKKRNCNERMRAAASKRPVHEKLLAVGLWLFSPQSTQIFTELIKPFSPALAGEKAFRSLRRRFDD